MPHLVLIYDRFVTVSARIAEIRREYKAATQALTYWRALGHTGQEAPYLEVVATLEAEFIPLRTRPRILIGNGLPRSSTSCSGSSQDLGPQGVKRTMKTTFYVSTICSAFGTKVLGTKVLWPGTFREALEAALEGYDPTGDRVPGQHFVTLPDTVLPVVSAGVARRDQVPGPEGYVVREHRGRCDAYARREYAAEATGVSVVVYTRVAYLADPDYTPEEVIPEDVTHVIVAVLAFAGPKPELSPYRLVHNLAGGNLEAETYTADEIRAKARASLEYDNTYVTVSD